MRDVEDIPTDMPALAAGTVKRSHLRASDEDYIAARSCAFLGLIEPFYQLSALAIEKALKTIIFLNGGKVEDTHDLARLSKLAQTTASFNHSTFLDDSRLAGRGSGFLLPKHSIESYLSLLTEQGSPTARYGGHGFLSQNQDLICLDNLYLRYRRLCVRLDSRLPDPNECDGERRDGPTLREILDARPLDMTSVVGRLGTFHSLGSEQAEILLRDNLLLSKSDLKISMEVESITCRAFRAENSLFGMLFDEKPNQEAHAALTYLLSAYPFRKKEKSEIQQALDSWYAGEEEFQ